MKYYPNAKLGYTDTESYIIEFPDKLKGFTEFVLKNREHFDLSGCNNRGRKMNQTLCIITWRIRRNKWVKTHTDLV